MINWIYIIAGWILLNIVAKLIINSIERIYKDKIDTYIVKMFSIIIRQTIRFLLFIFLLPTIIIVSFIPKKIFPSFFNEFRKARDLVIYNKNWDIMWKKNIIKTFQLFKENKSSERFTNA
jgi:hypothetical protein